jgi:hypothetical protein
MFEHRGVVHNVRLLNEDEDYEAAYTFYLFCEKCREKLDNASLDKWLVIGFPLVLNCDRCGSHIVVNFLELDTQVDSLNDRS